VIGRWSRHHIGERVGDLTVTQDRKAFEPNAGRIQTPTDERDEHLLQDGGCHRPHSNLPAADFCQRSLQLGPQFIAGFEALDNRGGKACKEVDRRAVGGAKVPADQCDPRVNVPGDESLDTLAEVRIPLRFDHIHCPGDFAVIDLDVKRLLGRCDDKGVRYQWKCRETTNDHSSGPGKIVVDSWRIRAPE